MAKTVISDKDNESTVPYKQFSMVRGDQSIGVFDYETPTKGNGITIIFVPAMGTWATYYRFFLSSLVAEGFHVITYDQRNVGTSMPRARKGVDCNFSDHVNDLRCIIDYAATVTPANKFILMGHSLGGLVSSALLSSKSNKDVQKMSQKLSQKDVENVPNSPQIEAVINIASASSAWYDYTPKWHSKYNVSFGRFLVIVVTFFLGYWPGHWFNYMGQMAKGIMMDWCHFVKTGRIPDINVCLHQEPCPDNAQCDTRVCISSVDLESGFKNIKVPSFFCSFEKDIWVTPKNVDIQSAKFCPEMVQKVHFGGSDVPSDHFKWARGANIGPVLDPILNFIQSEVGVNYQYSLKESKSDVSLSTVGKLDQESEPLTCDVRAGGAGDEEKYKESRDGGEGVGETQAVKLRV